MPRPRWLLLAAFAGSACTPDTPIRGRWEGRAGDERLSLTLTAAGDRVAGDGAYRTADYFATQRVSGTVVGAHVTLRLESAAPDPMLLVGRLVGRDTIRASLDSPEGSAAIVLTRRP